MLIFILLKYATLKLLMSDSLKDASIRDKL